MLDLVRKNLTARSKKLHSKPLSLAWVFCCFLLTFLAAWGWLSFSPWHCGRLVDALVADLLATLVIFSFSRAFRNSSFYDSYWSLAPPFFFLMWWSTGSSNADLTRIFLMAGVVLAWSSRLTGNWLVHWEGLHDEDWRYPMLRSKAPGFELGMDLLLIHVFPTLQVFLGMLPIYAATCVDSRPVAALDFVACAVGVAGVALELVADRQLHRFMKVRKEGELLDQGLWRYSRHPNYFGEFLFWLSLSLFGIAALPQGWWWQALGSLAMLCMFLFGSIPMMEKKLSTRPGYAAIVERVSPFIPWPPKKCPANEKE